MKGLPTLEGRLVKLNSFSPDYVNVYYRWMQDRYIIYMTEVNQDLTLEKVAEMRDSWENSSDMAHYLIFDKATSVPIGDVELKKIKFGESAFSGVMIADYRFRNKGYGAEAYKLILDYGFENLQLKKVVAYVFYFNQPAIILHKKMGFSEVGRTRDDIIFELARV